MTRLAIVGTGIAGLGCAHFLHRDFDLTLFEQGSYAGGHSNTTVAHVGVPWDKQDSAPASASWGDPHIVAVYVPGAAHVCEVQGVPALHLSVGK